MDQNQNRNQDPNNNKGPKNKQSLLYYGQSVWNEYAVQNDK